MFHVLCFFSFLVNVHGKPQSSPVSTFIILVSQHSSSVPNPLLKKWYQSVAVASCKTKGTQTLCVSLRKPIACNRNIMAERQTLGMGVSSTFGCIPIDVVFASIMPSSGWKLSRSARDKASPPTVSAISRARS